MPDRIAPVARVGIRFIDDVRHVQRCGGILELGARAFEQRPAEAQSVAQQRMRIMRLGHAAQPA